MMVEWRERLAESPVIIEILGRIGVGKSTLATGLGRKLGMVHIEENFPLNPFLKRFYDDPVRWSFHSQVWFLQKKITQLKNLDQSVSYFIDPGLKMDWIFAKTLARIGYMSKPEINTYEDLFETLIGEERIRKPSLFLLLDAKLPVIRERIIKRGRPFELKMLKEYPDYLSELHEVIGEFVSSQKSGNVLHGSDVIYVNTSQDNFIDKIHIDALAGKIKRKLNE